MSRPPPLANQRVLGRGPRYVGVGRRPFYRQSDLDQFIERHLFDHTAAERERLRGEQR